MSNVFTQGKPSAKKPQTTKPSQPPLTNEFLGALHNQSKKRKIFGHEESGEERGEESGEEMGRQPFIFSPPPTQEFIDEIPIHFVTTFEFEEFVKNDFKLSTKLDRAVITELLETHNENRLRKRNDFTFLSIFAGNVNKQDMKDLFHYPDEEEFNEKATQIKRKVNVDIGELDKVSNSVDSLLIYMKAYSAYKIVEYLFSIVMTTNSLVDSKFRDILNGTISDFDKAFSSANRIRKDIHSKMRTAKYDDIEKTIDKLRNLFGERKHMNPFRNFTFYTTNKKEQACVALMITDLIIMFASYCLIWMNSYNQMAGVRLHQLVTTNISLRQDLLTKVILLLARDPFEDRGEEEEEEEETRQFREAIENAKLNVNWYFAGLIDFADTKGLFNGAEPLFLIVKLITDGAPMSHLTRTMWKNITDIFTEAPLTEEGKAVLSSSTIPEYSGIKKRVSLLGAQAQSFMRLIFEQLENHVKDFCFIEDQIHHQIAELIEKTYPEEIKLKDVYNAALSNGYTSVTSGTSLRQTIDFYQRDPEISPLFAQLCAAELTMIQNRTPNRYIDTLTMSQSNSQRLYFIKKIQTLLGVKRGVDYGFEAMRKARSRSLNTNPLFSE